MAVNHRSRSIRSTVKMARFPNGSRSKTDEKPEEAPAPPDRGGETADGSGICQTEQEKEAKERDEKGKFAKKVEFSTEQQEVFDREFRKREAKIRREFEQKYAAKHSEVQPTAGEKQTYCRRRPNPSDLSPQTSRLMSGTLEELQCRTESLSSETASLLGRKERIHAARPKRAEESGKETEVQARKAHPDYKEEFESLAADIQSDAEPKLPNHVLRRFRTKQTTLTRLPTTWQRTAKNTAICQSFARSSRKGSDSFDTNSPLRNPLLLPSRKRRNRSPNLQNL
jgi:hypothetical protein